MFFTESVLGAIKYVFFHIRQPCSTESSSLWRKNGLSSGVVQKWTGQPFWVIARAFARTGFLVVWHAISKTETGCLHYCTSDTWKILSSTLASFLYCSGSLDKASELATSAESWNSISYLYDEEGPTLKTCSCQNRCGRVWYKDLYEGLMISLKCELAPKQVHVVLGHSKNDG